MQLKDILNKVKSLFDDGSFKSNENKEGRKDGQASGNMQVNKENVGEVGHVHECCGGHGGEQCSCNHGHNKEKKCKVCSEKSENCKCENQEKCEDCGDKDCCCNCDEQCECCGVENKDCTCDCK